MIYYRSHGCHRFCCILRRSRHCGHIHHYEQHHRIVCIHARDSHIRYRLHRRHVYMGALQNGCISKILQIVLQLRKREIAHQCNVK